MSQSWVFDLLILYPDSLDCGLFRDLVCIPGFRSYFCVSALCTPNRSVKPVFLSLCLHGYCTLSVVLTAFHPVFSVFSFALPALSPYLFQLRSLLFPILLLSCVYLSPLLILSSLICCVWGFFCTPCFLNTAVHDILNILRHLLSFCFCYIILTCLNKET